MKRLWIAGLFLAALLWSAASLALTETPASLAERYRLLTEPAELWEALADGTALFVDLRDEKAFNRLHIPGFINVPWEEQAVTALADTQGTIYLICETGRRGALAYNLLLEAGAPAVHAAAFGVEEYVRFAGMEQMEGADVCPACLEMEKEGLTP